MKTEREANHMKLLCSETNKVAGGEVGGTYGDWGMDIKKGTWWNEHRVFYATDAILNLDSEI